ncbi:DUF4230 domain-containing protein [Colwellia sp. C1TZA3]|uniref:DUF7281 domain-containing protein n=1 Tax=Colwellia sp. C1TZA3 TaxID=2508879 RepID=UPI0011B978E9|nr:DUF4230 domain-containing protein [Colwellia sp. C1TZA3]TWX73764.1 hypothetical protein ESZ39_02090 [Colwellia sp. C1TZA3]
MLQLLTKPQKTTLAKLLKKRAGTLPLPQFMSVHSSYGLGTIAGKSLRLSSQDFSELTLLFNKEIGSIDGFLMAKQALNRIEVSGFVHNEKQHTTAVMNNDIRIASLNGEIKVNDKVTSIPEYTSMTFQYHDIQTIEHDCVVVCENLQVFISLITIKPLLPESVQKALFIYRGHGKALGGVYRLCQRLSCPVIGMTDLDPKGIEIAYTLPRASACLYPNLETLKAFDLNTGRSDLWQAQANAILTAQRLSASSQQISALLEHLKNRASCYTQEILANQQARLELYLF